MNNTLSSVSDIGVKLIIISIVLTLLPQSPFVGFGNLVSNLPYLSFANWFLPISEMIAITESWLVVVSSYYAILYLVNYAEITKQ